MICTEPRPLQRYADHVVINRFARTHTHTNKHTHIQADTHTHRIQTAASPSFVRHIHTEENARCLVAKSGMPDAFLQHLYHFPAEVVPVVGELVDVSDDAWLEEAFSWADTSGM